MRVVAGELKGRRLHAPSGDAIRPTADKVREALFSILGQIEGATVLDLYCGTGALAIEALSRGASAATLVDTDIKAAARNVDDLDLSERARLVRSDVPRFLRGARSEERGASYDLVFLDPPYKLADRLEDQLDKLVPPRLAPGARVIVECANRAPLRLSLPLLSEHRYGDTLLLVHSGPEGS